MLACIFPLASCTAARTSDSGVSVYTNEDYHFKFTHPSSFSFKEFIESEEVADECDILFTGQEDDVITLSCRFNPEKTLHDYAKSKKFLPQNMTSVTPASFIYDMRDSDTPYYLIVSATKRMVVTAEYKYSDKNDEKRRSLCDDLKFEFTTYANVPGDNRFLSGDIYIADGKFSLNIPANATYELSPEPNGEIPEELEKGEDPQKYKNANCTDIDVFAKYYTAGFRAVEGSKSHFNDVLTDSDAEKTDASFISSLCGDKISNISISEKRLLEDKEKGFYICVNYTCEYNGEKGFGAYIAGYNEYTFYEYAYACRNDTPKGEQTQLFDLLASAEFTN